MGFIGGIILTVMLVSGTYKFLTTPEYRQKVGKEFDQDPVFFVFAMSGAVSFVIFMWGVCIPAIGEIKLPLTRKGVAIWQVAGLFCLAWLAVGLIGSYIREKRN